MYRSRRTAGLCPHHSGRASRSAAGWRVERDSPSSARPHFQPLSSAPAPPASLPLEPFQRASFPTILLTSVNASCDTLFFFHPTFARASTDTPSFLERDGAVCASGGSWGWLAADFECPYRFPDVWISRLSRGRSLIGTSGMLEVGYSVEGNWAFGGLAVFGSFWAETGTSSF